MAEVKDINNTIGRRKTAVARIYVKPGKGEINVNGRSLENYFPVETLQTIVKQPLVVMGQNANFDIYVNVAGGGVRGQAEAVRLAISRALVQALNIGSESLEDIEARKPLKKEGFLTRDPRMVERKKYGRRKARRRFQFSKR
ncbi:MAG TPA: 30S ribosomal protein S9 [Microscillaceae bacterium]|nr:30S ribosomal protein S9 [Microscillaceae bacterium]